MKGQYLPASTLAGLLDAWSDGSGPAYRLLSERLRLLIADGRIMPGARLPSERELTDALGVSRTTVASAYRELRDSGYLLSRRGSGSVTALPSKIEPELGRHHAPGIDTDGLYDFTCAAPSAVPGISAAVAEATADLPVHLATPGYHPQGLPVLRAEIAAAYEERGHASRATAREQVTAVAQLAVRRGDRRTADTERIGQLTLARQPRARHDPPVRDQQPEPLRQQPVRRSSPVGPGVEQAGERAGRKILTLHTVHYPASGYRIPGHLLAE